VPADHRKARRAAVHLVDLEDVRESPYAPLPLDEEPFGRRERAERRPSFLRRTIELARSNLLLNGGLRRKDFVGEVERYSRRRLVVVLSDALVELALEGWVLTHQTFDGRGAQPEQRAVRDGFDAGRARNLLEHRHLAEEIALPEIPNVLFVTVLAAEDPQATLLDDVHRAGVVTLTDDQVPLADRDGVEVRQHGTQGLCR
jgi:hypothetical protein